MLNKINQLITYANKEEILDQRDNSYMFNQLCYLLNVQPEDGYFKADCNNHIDDLLESIADDFNQFETQIEKELFKSKIIGTVVPRPSVIEQKFNDLYTENPTLATDYFYKFSSSVNYIKERQIKKNIEYKVASKYGDIDITINLSKPEKSTKEIEMLKNVSSSNWPKCFLCKEQEGLYGSLKNPDRSNHRIIKIDLNEQSWYLQYSPFSYFNEHAILLSEMHSDMKIDRAAFSNLLTFVEKYPHYMIGSNADIPIVGGSMLTHDHYQTGNFEFPIFRANSQIENKINNVEVHSVKWPLHTIKLVGTSKHEVLETCDLVLDKWLNYSNPECNIFAYTDVRHNTITPIFRINNNKYEAYLILRNNKTTDEHPTGLFHVDKSRHHIKQENIGLIEAIGLAVLPARLKEELEQIANCSQLPHDLNKHQRLFDQMINDNPTNKLQYLYELTGQIFVEGLEDCGVFKYDEEKYFDFIQTIC